MAEGPALTLLELRGRHSEPPLLSRNSNGTRWPSPGRHIGRTVAPVCLSALTFLHVWIYVAFLPYLSTKSLTPLGSLLAVASL